VRVEFGDETLRRLSVDHEHGTDKWRPDLVRAYRRRLQSLRAAKDREDLCALVSLDLQTTDNDDATCSSICLVGRSRLLLDFNRGDVDEDKVEADIKVTVLGIVDSPPREVSP
jgi:toxin HigB-1